MNKMKIVKIIAICSLAVLAACLLYPIYHQTLTDPSQPGLAFNGTLTQENVQTLTIQSTVMVIKTITFDTTYVTYDVRTLTQENVQTLTIQSTIIIPANVQTVTTQSP